MAAAGFWTWRVLFPGDESQIRKLLASVAGTASLRHDEHPLVKVGGANKLAGFFTRDIVIRLDTRGVQGRTINGREELIETVAAARTTLQSVKIEFFDIQVSVDKERETATAHLTALAEVGGEPDPVVQVLRMRLRKVDGDWLIHRVDPVQTGGLKPLR